MTWVRLDDQWFDHPKFLRVGDFGQLLWVKGLTYCARFLTDGFLPEEKIAQLVSIRAWKPIAEKLVKAGLWLVVDGGYQYHDYDRYQPSKAQIEAERAGTRDRMQRFRSKRVGDASGDAVTSSVTPPVIDGNVPGWGGRGSDSAKDSDPDPTSHREPPKPFKPRQPVRADGETGFAMFMRVFVEAWETKYKSKFIHTTQIGPGGDDMIFQRLGHAALEQPNPEGWVRHMVRSYLRDVDRWVVENNHPIVGLEKRVNKYGEPKGPPRSGVQVVGSQVRQEQAPVLLDMTELARRAEALAKAGKATG